MSCERTEQRLSEWAEDELGVEERREFEQHLEECGACSARATRFKEGLVRLRSVPVEDLSSDEVERMVAAAIPRSRPEAIPLMSGGSRRAGASIPWLSHAAAALFGAACIWLWAMQRPAERVVEYQTTSIEVPVEFPVEVTRDVVREVIREVPVEVVVEVPVEVLVEVPVEVRVEVPVEVRVEVPVEVPVYRLVFVARPAPAGQTDEPTIGPGASGSAQGALAHGAPQQGRSTNGAPNEAARTSVAQPRTAQPRTGAGSAPVSTSASPLLVRRAAGRVRLTTRGTLREIVPALVDALDGSDLAVTAAALDELQAIRRDLADRAVAFDEGFVEQDRIDRPGGVRAAMRSRGRADGVSSTEDARSWRAWWRRQLQAEGEGPLFTAL